MDLGEIQELTDPIPEEWTEDNLMEMRASDPVLEEGDVDAPVPENKLTLDNPAKGSDYSRLLLTSFIRWRLIWYGHWN